MTRFLILGEHRVGSNLLVTLLDSHPNCRAKSEILNVHYPLGRFHRFLRRRFPWFYFRLEAWGGRSGRLKAAGAKVFYKQLTYYWQVLDSLKGNRKIHVIHLTRENLLRRQLSLEMAKRTKKWTQGEGYQWKKNRIITDQKPITAPQEPITLDADQLRASFLQSGQLHADFRAAFSQHPLLEITYENLSEDRDPTLSSVLAFLGLDPHPMNSTLEKQITRPLSQMVTNYAELKAHFASTEWAHFFDE